MQCSNPPAVSSPRQDSGFCCPVIDCLLVKLSCYSESARHPGCLTHFLDLAARLLSRKRSSKGDVFREMFAFVLGPRLHRAGFHNERVRCQE